MRSLSWERILVPAAEISAPESGRTVVVIVSLRALMSIFNLGVGSVDVTWWILDTPVCSTKGVSGWAD